ncbi:MAG: plasmid pRiA4b ORF-3 family protein [Bacteroidota bacterium]|nr:plasmid pRiA4b ORF-3 family protein [Bacteroidota bacterium]
MKIYRFKVWFEDYPDVQRVIEIRGDQNFEQLHHTILKSVDFDNQQLASFFLWDNGSEDQIEITLIDMSVDGDKEQYIMENSVIENFVKQRGEVVRYEYDFVLLWTFLLELVEVKEDAGAEDNYPLILDSIGDAPDQYETIDKYPEAITDADERILDDLTQHNGGPHESDDDEPDWEIRDLFSDYEEGYDPSEDKG